MADKRKLQGTGHRAGFA